MTTEAVLDASAWFHFLEGTTAGARVRRFLAQAPPDQVSTPTIVVAEVIGKLRRSDRTPVPFLKALARHSTVEPLTQQVAELAGQVYGPLKLRRPDLSLADAVVLAHARSVAGRTLWTSDDALAGQPEVHRVE